MTCDRGWCGEKGTWALSLFGLALALSCAPTVVGRDLSKIPAGQVGFDDLCGLQGYFDALAVDSATPPRLVSAADVEGHTDFGAVRGGLARFAFETDFQLTTMRRILNDNWRRLPPGVATARRIEVEVHWSERAGLRRVVTDSDAELIVDGVSSSLPYQICLSELLFGDPLYRQRRDVLGLAPRPTAHPLTVPADRDGGAAGGAAGAGRPDAGSDAAPAAKPAAEPAPAARPPG
jgi:hypothetical protein